MLTLKVLRNAVVGINHPRPPPESATHAAQSLRPLSPPAAVNSASPPELRHLPDSIANIPFLNLADNYPALAHNQSMTEIRTTFAPVSPSFPDPQGPPIVETVISCSIFGAKLT
jgi:hypothetical protein